MKEMISEEDGSVSGSSDAENTQKRSLDLNNQDNNVTAKRTKVENFELINTASDNVNDQISQTMQQEMRAESEPEGEGDEIQFNEDSMSEVNENSDTSQNSISSSNNNNIDGQKHNFDTLDDSQQDDRSESPASVLIPENLQSNKDGVVENGRHLIRRTPSTTAGTLSTSPGPLEINEESSGGSIKDDRKDNESFLQRFEREHKELSMLMLLKEQEWNAILKLKKLKELKIAKLKRQKEVEELLGKSESGDQDFQKLLIQISEVEAKMGSRSESDIRNSIRKIEKEADELAKEVLNDNVQKPGNSETHSSSEKENSKVENVFLASNALKSLVSRNRATIASHSIPTSSVALASSCTSSKIIGEGRQGPIVEVTSLIADYRSKTQNDSSSEKKILSKQPSTPGTGPSYSPMSQTTTVSFMELLSRLKLLYEKDKDISSSTAIISNSNNNKTAPASKVKATNASNVSGSGVGKPPVGTTLAKLLSSNSVNPGSRNTEDSSSFNNKSIQNSSATNLDKNLSLANLLASAKSRDDPQKKKTDSPSVPLCQGCHASKAQFVCAGCANQWYCSRECQVAAWDEHSEVCSG